jgi:hypothetical protein
LLKGRAREVFALALAAALVSTLGCARAAALAAPMSATPCRITVPSTARKFNEAEAVPLAGEYRLTLVSTWLEDAGRTTEGHLSLWVADTLRRFYEPQYLTIYDSTQPPEKRLSTSRVVLDSIVRWDRSGYDRPLLGALEIDLQPVSAPAEAHLASRDPNEPGARLEGRELHLTPVRLGLVSTDASFTTLRINAVDDRAFYGRWTTDFGLGRLSRNGRIVPNPSGYFCAQRL